MDAAPPDYTVVVPAWNEEALLPGTLATLRDAMVDLPWRGEVVVCDNNSKDGTAAAARAAGARVVFEPHNQIACARNAGAAASRGRWLVFVDADTQVPAAALREALDLLASDRCVGGGSVFRMESAGNLVGRPLVRLWTWISLRFHVAAGSFLFARRDAFDAVGGFSRSVYAGEEIWMTRALKRWGRPRGLAFRVLERHPVTTSGRKLAWFSAWSLLGTVVLFTVFPFAARSRRLCGLWYRRPAPG